MKKFAFAACFISSPMLFLNACATASTTITTTTPFPSQEPSPTMQTLTVTPVETAFAAGNPTASPLDATRVSYTVTFDTTDDAEVNGELYGSGKTAVNFSVMGNCKP